MNLPRQLSILLLTIILPWAGLACSTDAQSLPLKLSQLDSAKALLGEGWNGPKGLCVDDLNELSHLKGDERTVAETIAKQAIPNGWTSMAEWSFKKHDQDEFIEVRIFRFKDRAAAEKWWESRYAAKSSTSQREEIANVGDKAYRSQTKVAALGRTATLERVLCGDTIVVVDTMEPAESCRKVLLHYVNQLQPHKKN